MVLRGSLWLQEIPACHLQSSPKSTQQQRRRCHLRLSSLWNLSWHVKISQRCDNYTVHLTLKLKNRHIDIVSEEKRNGGCLFKKFLVLILRTGSRLWCSLSIRVLGSKTSQYSVVTKDCDFALFSKIYLLLTLNGVTDHTQYTQTVRHTSRYQYVIYRSAARWTRINCVVCRCAHDTRN